jgi:uncharacterized membrane protein
MWPTYPEAKKHIEKKEDDPMTLLASLIIRTVLIIAITDVVIFYVIQKRKMKITVPLVLSVIVVTLIPLIINIWVALHLFGIK